MNVEKYKRRDTAGKIPHCTYERGGPTGNHTILHISDPEGDQTYWTTLPAMPSVLEVRGSSVGPLNPAIQQD